MAKASPNAAKAASGSTGEGRAAIGAVTFWLLLQGSQLSVIESQERPEIEVGEGESKVRYLGVYQTREMAMARAEEVKQRQFGFQREDVA